MDLGGQGGQAPDFLLLIFIVFTLSTGSASKSTMSRQLALFACRGK